MAQEHVAGVSGAVGNLTQAGQVQITDALL